MPPPSPHNSSTPLISSSERQGLQQAGDTSTEVNDKGPKASKRGLFGFGRKKEDKQAMDAPALGSSSLPETQPAVPSPLKQQQQQTDLKSASQTIPVSPLRQTYHPAVAASPSRLRSSSPRHHSPASSEIFERNVQEPIPISTLGGELDPAHIPAHVITEDAIPPALEASVQAITSEELNPDEVEIVTSASHQTAAVTLEGSASHADLSSLNSPLHPPPSLYHERSVDSDVPSGLHHQSSIVPALDDDTASNYGQLDPNDVRRLSFISFKDIVQSEHQQAVLGDLGSLHNAALQDNRAASPFRTPRSPTIAQSPPLSGGLTTPPTGINAPPFAASSEQSPVRSAGIGSPGPHQHGELTIETMRQALRKTASGDLSGGRSTGMSPISDESSFKDPSRCRTNS